MPDERPKRITVSYSGGDKVHEMTYIVDVEEDNNEWPRTQHYFSAKLLDEHFLLNHLDQTPGRGGLEPVGICHTVEEARDRLKKKALEVARKSAEGWLIPIVDKTEEGIRAEAEREERRRG